MKTTRTILFSAMSALFIVTATGASAASGSQDSGPYGQAVAGTASRVVMIDPASRYVNVTRLETVSFVIDGKTTTWHFDTLGTRSFPLSKAIPGANGVQVYLTESPMYTR